MTIETHSGRQRYSLAGHAPSNIENKLVVLGSEPFASSLSKALSSIPAISIEVPPCTAFASHTPTKTFEDLIHANKIQLSPIYPDVDSPWFNLYCDSSREDRTPMLHYLAHNPAFNNPKTPLPRGCKLKRPSNDF